VSAWPLLPFDEAVEDASGGNIKTKQNDYAEQGSFAIVDQGKALIAGYTDDPAALCKAKLPVVVFGDHTRCLKYVDFSFGMGADGVKVLRPRVELDVKFLYHYLCQLKLPDGGYDRHFKYLKRESVPVPPLEEQRRIAAILDQAETLRTQRRTALALLDTLTQSIFLDMFGTVASPKYTNGTIRPFVDANSGKSAKTVLSSEITSIPIYGGNGINGWATSALYDHPVLVFGRVGQQCGNAFITEGPSWVTDNAIVIRISDASKLLAKYVLHAFQQSDFSNRVKHLDLPFINQGMILDNPIPLAPLPLQKTFATRIQAIEALKSTHRTALAQLDALFASLQHRAFSGTL
jgi:type I restriction enzyme, S subunit